MITVSDIARAVHCHPNTVRLYEKWGYLPPIPREKNGYRNYSEGHLRQMVLARAALPGPFPGGGAPVYRLVREAAKSRFGKALELALLYKKEVIHETHKASSVLTDLGKWARGARSLSDRPRVFSRRRAAVRLRITVDMLRTWERNGLLHIRKNLLGYCEYSEKDLARIRIISALRTAGYSIASIHKMFFEFDNGKLTDTAKKTLAAVLDTPDPDAPIVYVTDRWLTLLREHKKRAARVTRLLLSMRKSICNEKKQNGKK